MSHTSTVKNQDFLQRTTRDTIMKKDTDIQNLHNALRARVRGEYHYFHFPRSEIPGWRAAAHGHKVCQWQSEDKTPADHIPATRPILEKLLARVSFSNN